MNCAELHSIFIFQKHSILEFEQQQHHSAKCQIISVHTKIMESKSEVETQAAAKKYGIYLNWLTCFHAGILMSRTTACSVATQEGIQIFL